jgi:hypothetical protein
MASNSDVVELKDGTKIKVLSRGKAKKDLAEFVQITSADRVKLDAKERAVIQTGIVKKQHEVYKKMDLPT